MDPVTVSHDPSDVDLGRLCAWLAKTYWAKDRSPDLIAKSLARSFCFTARQNGEMVGFARVVSDGATFAWLCDVVVDPARHRQGIGRALVAAVLAHPELATVRWMLATLDAHPLYEEAGFIRVTERDLWMTKGFRTYREPGP